MKFDSFSAEEQKIILQLGNKIDLAEVHFTSMYVTQPRLLKLK